MLAQAHDAAVAEDDDLVGVADRAHALGDDEHGGVGKLALERVAQRGVGLVVERAERVVEDVEVRAARERAGDAQALALAAREVRAPLRDARGKAVLELMDERALCDVDGVPEPLVVGALVAVAEVVGDGPREEPRLLRHVADARAELRLRQVTNVNALELERSHGCVEQAQKELGDGRLSGAGVSDDGRGLATAQGEVEVV